MLELLEKIQPTIITLIICITVIFGLYIINSKDINGKIEAQNEQLKELKMELSKQAEILKEIKEILNRD